MLWLIFLGSTTEISLHVSPAVALEQSARVVERLARCLGSVAEGDLGVIWFWPRACLCDHPLGTLALALLLLNRFLVCPSFSLYYAFSNTTATEQD